VKKCEEILELLSLYIDNELDNDTARSVKEHIDSCSSCKTEMDQLVEIINVCNRTDEVELPDDFNDVLHQKLKLEKKNIEDNKKTIVLRNRILKTVTSVAAIFIVIFALRGLMNIETFDNGKSVGKYSIKEDTKDGTMSVQREAESQDGSVANNWKGTDEISMNGGSKQDLEMGTQSRVAGGTNSQKEDAQLKDFGHGGSQNSDTMQSKPNEGIAPVRTFSESNPPENILPEKASPGNVSPENMPPDSETIIEFTEEFKPEENSLIMTTDTKEDDTQNIIYLTVSSRDFESDRLKIIEIADEFGTKIGDNYMDHFDDTITTKDLPRGESTGYNIAASMDASIDYDMDYIVSYNMDKTSYEQFIKQFEENFGGEYSLNSDCVDELDDLEKVRVDINIYSD